MAKIIPLPKIMVAPNGARRTKEDHPALPIRIDEIIETAKSCAAAGADGIHIHVRDQNGSHVLDAGLYNEALRELEIQVPSLARQITTEAVGIYTPEEQRELIRAIKPLSVSVSIAEMFVDDRTDDITDFYRWCRDEGVAVQHILYGKKDMQLFDKLLNEIDMRASRPQLLFVLGRYAQNQESQPDDLDPFSGWLQETKLEADWAVCAFGRGETDCLVKAHRQGGKLRVGFENSLWNRDGTRAQDNAERVREVVQSIS